MHVLGILKILKDSVSDWQQGAAVDPGDDLEKLSLYWDPESTLEFRRERSRTVFWEPLSFTDVYSERILF